MEMVYILSCHDNTGTTKGLTDGVWGVYSSFDNAHIEMTKFIEDYEEVYYDEDNDNFLYRCFTSKSTWIIEPFKIDCFAHPELVGRCP